MAPEDPARAIRALYDRHHPRTTSPLLLPTSWLDAAVHPRGPLLEPGARVLVAGCGHGEELVGLATLPGLELVGVDFSTVALEHARERVPAGVVLEQADLTDRSLPDRLGPFDLVLCNAVADYVPDAPGLLTTLAGLVAPTGALYLGSNTPHHPRARVHAALNQLGIAPDDLDRVRSALRVMDAIRPEAPRLADLEDGMLAVDVLVPFAHHWPLRRWQEVGAQAGLHLFGTLGVPGFLGGVADHDLPRLYGQGRAELALLHDRQSDDGGRGALFVHQLPVEPPWRDPEALWAWVPVPDPGLQAVPPLAGDAAAVRTLTLSQAGWGDWTVPVPAWALELLRQVDGRRSVAELRADLQRQGSDEGVVAALFRAFHACLVR